MTTAEKTAIEKLENIYHELYETDIDEGVLIDILNLIDFIKGKEKA